jgi:beta-lactamase regulating signal transducer with metallopeptidase domain
MGIFPERSLLVNRIFGALDSWLIDIYLLSTVLIVLGGVCLIWLRQPARRMAAARSIIVGLGVFVVLAAAPGWPRIGGFGWPSVDATPIRSGAVSHAPIESAAASPTDREMSEPIQLTTATVPAVHRAVTLSPPSSIPVVVPNLLPWRMINCAAFAVGAALNLAWLMLGAIQALRLRRTARFANELTQKLMARMVGDRQQQAGVFVSDRIGLPVAIGVLRPMIVLPANFVTTEPDDCLEAALAHEWAHIENGDLRWLALLRLLNVVLYAQPLFWWLRFSIRADQEVLADAAASTLDGDGRLAYAETLVGWARSSHRQQPGALASAALALWERPSTLHRRVRLLLDREFHVEKAAPRRWTMAAICLGMLAAFLLSMFTLRPSTAMAKEIKEATQVTQNHSTDASRAATPSGDRFEYAGRVLDPDGKPLAGAKLHLAHFRYTGQVPPAVRATSDSGGRFRIELPQQELVDWTTKVVATADGFGLGWADAGQWADSNASEPKKIDTSSLTIRLVRDDAPIAGRLVDLEGRPVVGATIRPEEILEPPQGDLAAFIAASTSGEGGSHEIEREYLKGKLWPRASGLPATILTDSDGRFSIRGVGAERLLRLTISGPTVQTKKINVLTRSLSPFLVTAARGSPDWGIALYYGASFTHAAAPTKLVHGVVKDKETGQPLVGVRIVCTKTAEYSVYGPSGIEATTDEQGRYRLVGLPKGSGNHSIAIPAGGQPYLASGVEIPNTPGLEPVSLDIALKRGVVIEGRVIDKKTLEPLKAFVEYHSYLDNPNLADAPGFDRARVEEHVETKPDGSYRVVGLPGHGLLAAAYTGGAKQYLKGMGVPGGDVPGGILPIVPNGMMWEFNLMSEVNLPQATTTFHTDIALETGVTRSVRVVDPDGRALNGARIKLQPHILDLTPPQQTTEFSVEALRPNEVRPLLAFHDERKLAGHIEIKANEQGIAELKMEPWAILIGRLVDEVGDARAKVDIVNFARELKPVTTDSQGRFRIDALVPGLAAEVWVSPMTGALSGTVAKGLVMQPGEIKDLGDVRERQ